MKADKIIKNAKVFTADKNQPLASAQAKKIEKGLHQIAKELSAIPL